MNLRVRGRVPHRVPQGALCVLSELDHAWFADSALRDAVWHPAPGVGLERVREVTETIFREGEAPAEPQVFCHDRFGRSLTLL